MAIGRLKDIYGQRPEKVRLLGLDIGTKTIGLAVCDSEQKIATPVTTIQRKKFTKDILEIQKIINDFNIGGYVIGFPLNMDGTEGPKCDSVTSFAEEMSNHPDIFGDDPWIALHDERLSTVSVEDFLVNTVDMSRTKRKQVVDKLAAQIILQDALDFITNNKTD